MAQTVNTNLGSSIPKFQFTDDDGEVVASFRLNPADVRLAGRVQEAANFFRKASQSAPEQATAADILKYNNDVEEEICRVLGYDAHQELFGFMSATTILEDGEMFAQKILDMISEAVLPEIQKRKAALAAAVKKHTAKYE